MCFGSGSGRINHAAEEGNTAVALVVDQEIKEIIRVKTWFASSSHNGHAHFNKNRLPLQLRCRLRLFSNAVA
jgi:hypothetical protein